MSAKSFLTRRVVVFSFIVSVVALVALGKFVFVSEAGRESSAMLPVTASIAQNFPAGAGGDVDGDGKADPGDTIEYVVTINNAGAGDATGVTVTDTLQNELTLAGGTLKISPIVVNEAFPVTGNLTIQVPDGASDLLANDINPNTGSNAGLTVSAPPTTTQGGSLNVLADGSFSYNPPPGYTGADTASYTVTGAGGATTTGTVTFNVSGMIWFINAAAAPGGDGRLNTPFNCFNGVTASCFNITAADDPGDVIFLYNGSYTGGYTLLDNQRLIGQGAAPAGAGTLASIGGLTLAPFSDTLPSTGANPDNVTITSTANGITLGQNNILRGFRIGATTGAKISGNAFGTLVAGNTATPDLKLEGAGQALGLLNGSFDASSAFSSVATTSAAGSGEGVSLNQVGGTVAFGSTQISGSTTAGVSVVSSTVNVNFGNTSVTGGTQGVLLQGNTAGTRTFGTLTIQNNSGVGFMHAAGGGAAAVTGAATITNPGSNCISIAAATTAVTFANVAATQCGATGVFINNSSSASGTVTFADLDITPDAGVRAFQSQSSLGTITTTSGTINETGAGGAQAVFAITGAVTPLNMTLDGVTSLNDTSANGGIDIDQASGSLTIGTTTVINPTGIGIRVLRFGAGTVSFGTTSVTGSGNDGVRLGETGGFSNTGNFTFGALTITPDAGARGLWARENAGTITIPSGTITTSGQPSVEITKTSTTTPINITLTGVTTSSAAESIRLVNVSGTKFQVTGTTQINTRVNGAGGFGSAPWAGIFVDNSSATSIQFAAVNIANPNAAGGHGIHVEDSSSAVTIATVAISDANITVAQTDPGSDGFPDTDGDGDGIFLRGNSGLFTLNGGTISSPGNDGIDARSTRIAVTGVTITNPGQDVTGATGEGYGGHGIYVMNPAAGTGTIATTTISGFNVANRSGLVVNSNTGTATLTVTGSTFQNATGNTGATSLVNGTGNLTLTFGGASNNVATNCTFTNISASALVPRSAGTGILNFTVQNSTFQNAPLNGKTNVTGGTSDTATGNFTIINNTFNGVFKTASTGEALISFVGLNSGGTNTFGLNISGNTISGVGLNNNTCTGGAWCGGPLEAILAFVDDNTDVNGTININNNIISDVQQGGILLDMANDQGGNIDAKITGNTVGTDANPVGRGPSASVTTQFGIEVFRRRVGAETANVLISGNSVRNGNGTPTTLNAGIFVRGEADTNLSTTITNNNVNTLSSGPVEIRVDANSPGVSDPDTSVVCADISGNTVAGGAGGIDLNEVTTNTLNIEQASGAAVAAANGIPAGNVTPDAGVAFGVACATPPAVAEETASVTTENSGDYAEFLQQPSQTPGEMLALIEPFVRRSPVTEAISKDVIVSVSGEASAEVISADKANAEMSEAGYMETAAGFFAEISDKLSSAVSPTVSAQNKEAAQLSGETITVNGSGSGFTIPSGKSLTVTFKATVNNGPFNAGVNNISNNATVTGSPSVNVTTNTVSLALDAAPDLEITTTDTGATTQPGGTASYILNYRNITSNRTQNATGVVVSHVVPANATFNAASSTVGFSCADGAPAGTNCTFNVGALNAGGNGFVTFVVNVLDALPTDVQQLSTTAAIADDGANGADLNAADNTGTETTAIIGNWLGDTSNDWFVATNWSSGVVPPAGNNISIPPAAPTAANTPSIPSAGADVSIGKLTLNGANLSIGAGRILNASGNVALGANLVTGAGTLALGAASNITRSTGQVESTLKKTFGGAGPLFTFPVGTTGAYSPVDVTVTAGAGDLSVKANAGTSPATPPINDATTLDRYWTLEGSGITSDVKFNYLTSDVDGNEAAYNVIRSPSGGGAPVIRYAPNGSTIILDTANNFFTVKGLQSYSNWTAGEPLAPTAATVNVSGQVLDAGGRPVGNAQLTMVGADGLVKLARTNPFGYYRFFDIPAGVNYTVNVNHKLNQFTPQVLFVEENIENLNFVATP